MRRAFALKFRDHVGQPEKKKHYNEQLFTEVAPKYDFITKALSLGRDAAWKKHLCRALPDCANPFCVDLACGTGDVSFLLARKYPEGTVLGLDLTESMLRIAAQRQPSTNLTFAQRDMCDTGLESHSVDIVTGSYALRNAPELNLVLDEISRILKPGGTAAFLDFSKPRAKFLQFLEYGLLKMWGSLWGLLLHRNHEVYAYIAESLAVYPDRIRLRECFRAKGFDVVECRHFYFGIMELIVVRKETKNGESRKSNRSQPR